MSHGLGCALLQTSLRLTSLRPEPSSADDPGLLVGRLLKECSAVWAGVHRELVDCIRELTGRPRIELNEALNDLLSSSGTADVEKPELRLPRAREGRGALGRCLLAVGGVERGEELLREKPVCATRGLLCRCGERSSPLLPEHVEMALLLHQGGRHSTDLLRLLDSHLPEESVDVASPGHWSVASRVLMTTIAVLTVLAVQKLRASGFDLHSEATHLFEILVRLPTNVHAVSSLAEKTSDGAVVEVTQERRVLALFLGASAINHSCSPNAVLRDEAGYISVVASTSIPEGKEVTISYGPVARMDVRQRRQVLREQYLFSCECPACERDGGRVREERRTGKIDDASLMEEVRTLTSRFQILVGADRGFKAPMEFEAYVRQLHCRLIQREGAEPTYNDEMCYRQIGRLLSSARDLQAR